MADTVVYDSKGNNDEVYGKEFTAREALIMHYLKSINRYNPENFTNDRFNHSRKLRRENDKLYLGQFYIEVAGIEQELTGLVA